MSELADISVIQKNYEFNRNKRLELEKHAKEFEKLEQRDKAQLIKLMQDHQRTEIVTNGKRIKLEEDIKPVAEDWGLVYNFILQNNAFDLLHKRLTESAVEARWEDGVAIPGINKFPVTKLSITAV